MAYEPPTASQQALSRQAASVAARQSAVRTSADDLIRAANARTRATGYSGLAGRLRSTLPNVDLTGRNSFSTLLRNLQNQSQHPSYRTPPPPPLTPSSSGLNTGSRGGSGGRVIPSWARRATASAGPNPAVVAGRFMSPVAGEAVRQLVQQALPGDGGTLENALAEAARYAGIGGAVGGKPGAAIGAAGGALYGLFQ